MHAARIPRDVFEIAQERPADPDREVAAQRRALRVERGDERLIEQSKLPHPQRQAIAIRAAVEPLA